MSRGKYREGATDTIHDRDKVSQSKISAPVGSAWINRGASGRVYVPDHGEMTVSINVLLKNVVIVPWDTTVGLGCAATGHPGYKNFGQWGLRDRQTTRIVAWRAAKTDQYVLRAARPGST